MIFASSVFLFFFLPLVLLFYYNPFVKQNQTVKWPLVLAVLALLYWFQDSSNMFQFL